jgi:hypothetical protein
VRVAADRRVVSQTFSAVDGMDKFGFLKSTQWYPNPPELGLCKIPSYEAQTHN